MHLLTPTILLLGFCLAALPLRAQYDAQKVDSLERLIVEIEDDSLYVKMCVKLAQYLRHEDAEKAIYYARIGVNRARGQEAMARDECSLLFSLANIHTELGDFEAAEKFADTLLRFATEVKDTISIIRGNNASGVLAQQRSRYEQALVYFLANRRLAEQAEMYYNAYLAEVNFATVLAETERYREAIAHVFASLELFKKRKKSNEYHNSLVSGVTFSNMAYNYNQLKEADSARVWLSKSIPLLRKVQAYNFLSDAYYNMAEAFKLEENFDSALVYYRKSIDLERRYNEYATFGADYNGIGKVFLLAGQLDSAEFYLTAARDTLKDNPDVLVERTLNYRYLSELYEAKNDPVQALFYYKKFKTTDDSLLNTKRTEQVEELRTRYQTERRERENEFLRAEAKQKEKELTQSRIITGGSLAMILGIGLFAFQVTRSRRRLSLKNAVIASKNQQLSNLIRDHHHRFKNQYQLLTGLMDMESAEGHISREVARSYQIRMKAMREMEDLLAQRDFTEETSGDLLLLPLIEQFRTLFFRVNEKEGQQLRFELEIPPAISFPLPIMGNLLLLVSELSANATKHNQGAEALDLYLELETNDEEHFVLTLRDNGSGWSDNPKEKTSVGWQIIQVLIEELPEGQWRTYNEGGAVVEISFARGRKNAARIT